MAKQSSPSIVDIHEYTSVALWRKEEQLRGLIKNHPMIVTESENLVAKGTLFSSAQLALHNTEDALCVGLNPIGGTAALGMLPLSGDDHSLDAVSRIRWLDVNMDGPLSGVDWCNDLAVIGSSRGRVFVCEQSVKSASESSGVLEPVGCLVTTDRELAVGDITVTPSSHAASTLVRSLKFNADVNPMSLVGVRGSAAFIWDLNGQSEPVRAWSLANAVEPSVLMFATWAPSSHHTVLCGAFDGGLSLVDVRTPGNEIKGLEFTTQRNFCMRSGDFSTILPFCIAAASSTGAVSIFDIRFTTKPVRVLSSLQGDVSCVRWDRQHADLLYSGGSDGSVGMWCLRSAPTFCVGRAMYRMPVSSIVATKTFAMPRVFGITSSGEIVMNGLSDDALRALAPLPTLSHMATTVRSGIGSGSSLSRNTSISFDNPSTRLGNRSGGASFSRSVAESVRRGGAGTAAEKSAAHMSDLDCVRIQSNERNCMGLLYTRKLREGFSALAACAAERFAWKDTINALKLVSLIDVVKTPVLDYDKSIEVYQSGDISNLVSHHSAVDAFEALLSTCSEQLSTTVPLSSIRGFEKPSPEDIRHLEALRLNILMRQLLDSGDVDVIVKGIAQQMQVLSASQGNLDLIDHDTICGIAVFLLRERYEEGSRFLNTLFDVLIRKDGTSLARPLVRRLMLEVQKPLVTTGAAPRAIRRFEDAFFRDLNAARRAVATQMEIQGLGIENSAQVVSIITQYQASCAEREETGIFGWLSLKPILLFLHCLAAQSNYAAFFWMCVQLIEAFAKYPGVKQIESVLFETVDRIQTAGLKIRENLTALSETKRFSVPTMRQAEEALKMAHGFLTVLLRVELECEKVTVESNLSETPAIMVRILDVLGTASTDLLQSWADLMDALMDCGQKDLVHSVCLAAVRAFSYEAEDLMQVSVEKEHDETLNNILDICDEFIDTIDG